MPLGNYLLWDYDFAGSERELRRAIALNPSYAMAHHRLANCLEQLGRKEEAMREVLLAEELDPLSIVLTLAAMYRCIWAGRYQDAQERIRKIKEIDPASPLLNEALMVYHFNRKEWDDALVHLRKMIEDDPADPYLDSDLAYIDAVTGKREDALKLIEKLKTVPDSARIKGDLIGMVYAGLGDLDECFRWFDYAVENREFFLGFFRVNPAFETVSRDPRFSELLKRAGLPP